MGSLTAPRTVFQGSGKKAGVPDPAKLADRHNQLGALMLKAELAPDPLERLLAVCRVVLTLATDVLRQGQAGFTDVPTVLLGQHHLSRRALADRHKGDGVQLFLQELCSHEPLGPTPHAKYSAPGSRELATLALSLAPSPAIAQPKAGLAELLVGASSAGSEPYLECSFEGASSLTFPRHSETYTFGLPSLLLLTPLEDACQLDLAGSVEVRCQASSLAAQLRFKRGRRLKGSVSRVQGPGARAGQPVEVALLDGSWAEGSVTVESLEAEAAGVLFDASQLEPPLATTIRLAEPGPRAWPRLWSAVLEGLSCLDAKVAARQGKRVEELAVGLRRHLARSLLYEVESTGRPSKPKQGEAAESEAAGAGGGPPLPPCVLAHRAKYGAPALQLHYRLQSVAV